MPAWAGLVEGSRIRGSACSAAGNVGSTRRSNSVSAAAPLKHSRAMRRWPCRNDPKSFGTTLSRRIRASRLPGRTAAAQTSHSATRRATSAAQRAA